MQRYITLFKLKKMVWNAVGWSTDTIMEYLHSDSASWSHPHLHSLFVASIVIITIIKLLLLLLLHPRICMDGHGFCPLCFNFSTFTLFAALRQADFLHHALTFRFTQWVMITQTQSGSTTQSPALPKWLIKERRLVVNTDPTLIAHWSWWTY